MNNTVSTRNSQANKEALTAFLEINPIINSLPGSIKKTYLTLAKQSLKHKVNYIAQGTVALWHGKDRTTINHHVAVLKNQGLLIVENHPYTTNSYFLPERFYTETYRKAFLNLFAICSVFTLNLLLSKPALAECRTLYVKGYIYKNLNLTYNPNLVTRGAPSRDKVRFLNKEVEVMEAQNISPAIRNIRSLDLTNAGIADASRYSDEAIRYADKHFKPKEGVDHFQWFCGIAKQESIRKNLPIINEKAHSLLASFNISREEPRYTPRVYLQRDRAATNQQASHFQGTQNQGKSGQQLEKVAPKRNLCTMNYDSGRFITLKVAEYGLVVKVGTSSWDEHGIKDYLESKGYSKRQLQEDYEVWLANERAPRTIFKASENTEDLDRTFTFENLAKRVAALSLEDPFAAALKVEINYAQGPCAKDIQAQGIHRFNPWLEKLTQQEQDQIKEIAWSKPKEKNE